MSITTKIDPSTLGWVKTEIDETLKQARLAFEGFVENNADDAKLRHCITYLHQVVGTLQMVELDGAALLGRETEALAEALLAERAPREQAVFELLTRGILSLPDYLARLQYGQPDAPMRLLPLVNELRAAHKAEAISRLELFQPDLSVRPPRSGERARRSLEEYVAVAKRLRPEFQKALLAWLKNPTDGEMLARMETVLAELEHEAHVGIYEQLFWVSGGLLSALASGDLEITNERKKLLARLEQQMKKLAEGGDKGALRASSEALLKTLLLELAEGAGRHEKVRALKAAFDLDTLLGLAPETSAEVDGLPTPEVIHTVALELGKEVEQAQDILAAYLDPVREDVGDLAGLVALLDKMSGTLEMLGVPVLKALVDEIIECSRALDDGSLQINDASSMQLAGALLLIENSARQFHASGSAWKKQIEDRIAALKAMRAGEALPGVDGIEISDATLTEAEFKQLLSVVSAEIRINLAKVEEALEGFASNPDNAGPIETVPHFLSQIQGALQILGQEAAAELAAVTASHIERIQRRECHADHAVFDALAVAVGTIEVYLEGLERDRPNLETLIHVARQELDAALGGAAAGGGASDTQLELVRVALDAWLAEPTDAQALDALSAALEGLHATALAKAHEKVMKIVAEMQAVLALVHEEPAQFNDDVRDTLRTSFEIVASLWGGATQDAVPAAPTASVAPASERTAATRAPAPAQSKPAHDAGLEDLDEEIMQIFIEDAKEVYQNIEKSFAAWQVEPGNQEALLELRRAFHTLKGSGRMVGAGEIAELAWAVENLLNQIREGKLSHSPDIFALVTETKAVLPTMIAQLEGGPAPTDDIEALRVRANALAGKPATPPVTLADSRREVAVAEGPAIDPALLQIFSGEAGGHVATIKETCAQGAGSFVHHGLLRAAHTLQGNARSLNLAPMAAAAAETERFLQALELRQQPLNETGIELLATLARNVERLLASLNVGATPDSSLKDDFARLAHAIAIEHARMAAEPAPSATDEDNSAVGATGDEAVFEIPAEIAVPDATAPVEVWERANDGAPTAASPALEMPPVHPTPVERDVVDAELIDIFHEEAVDILENIEEGLTKWRAKPTDSAPVHALKRALHTLKGGARMSGAMTIGNISHNAESLIKHVEDGRMPAGAELMDLLDEVHDGLVVMLRQVREGQPYSHEVRTLNTKLLSWLAGNPVTQVASEPAPAVEAPTLDTAGRSPIDAPMANGNAKTTIAGSGVSDVLTADTVADAPATPVNPRSATPPPTMPTVTTSPVTTPIAASTTAKGDDEDDEDAPAFGMRKDERREQIKVRTALLNELVNYAGEVSISRSRMEQQIFGFREHLSELSRNVVRFREQIRDLEIQSESQILYRAEQQGASTHADFDPLEFDRFSKLQQLSRSLAESLHDLSTIQGTLDNFAGEAETVLQQQARVNTELQEGLMRTRMINFSTQSARLRHIVRQTSRELGKRAELNIAGAEVEVDRNVLERMIGPFEHMIRNALDHGIEPEAERARLNKPAVGRIAIDIKQEGSEIAIRFADDGSGLNVKAIRAKAIDRGLIKSNAALSDEEVMQFILLPGFSTAEKVTHVSGRGVGMDVVHNEVKQLGGSITVETQRGIGTTFVVRLPLTLSITQALMIHVGEQMFAVPLASIVNILEVPVEKLNNIAMGERAMFHHEDQVYPFMDLAARLALPSLPRNARKVPVLLAKSGNRQIAIQIDGLSGTQEVVIKSLGPQLSEIKGLAGATVLGDGKVILILDIGGLWITDDAMRLVRAESRQSVATEPEEKRKPLVMVVDDSLTVRKVTSRHLQKRGMDVLVAKDGLDAWEQLREAMPDVMLVDIEMPRMDGYELTANIRSSSAHKHIPIIMITSRAGTKHRDRAIQLGVNLYMSKPYQEEELMRNIESMLPQALLAE